MVEFSSAEEFVKVVREIVYDFLKKTDLRIEQFYDGVIFSVDADNNTADVSINDVLMSGLKNKTGVELFSGDAVRIYTTNASMIDAYIGVKM